MLVFACGFLKGESGFARVVRVVCRDQLAPSSLPLCPKSEKFRLISEMVVADIRSARVTRVDEVVNRAQYRRWGGGCGMNVDWTCA